MQHVRMILVQTEREREGLSAPEALGLRIYIGTLGGSIATAGNVIRSKPPSPTLQHTLFALECRELAARVTLYVMPNLEDIHSGLARLQSTYLMKTQCD